MIKNLAAACGTIIAGNILNKALQIWMLPKDFLESLTPVQHIIGIHMGPTITGIVLGMIIVSMSRKSEK